MNLNYDYIYQLFIIVIDIMDKITILVAFITLFFVIRNWLNNRKQLKAIKILLDYSSKIQPQASH